MCQVNDIKLMTFVSTHFNLLNYDCLCCSITANLGDCFPNGFVSIRQHYFLGHLIHCHTHLPHPLRHASFTVAVLDECHRMSKSRNSQKLPKDVGTCGVCWGSFKVQCATGFIHRHDLRDNPCAGSDKPPAAVSQLQPPQPTSQHQANVSHLHSVVQSPASVSH